MTYIVLKALNSNQPTNLAVGGPIHCWSWIVGEGPISMVVVRCNNMRLQNETANVVTCSSGMV